MDAATVAYLEGYRFTGSMTGYREGELYFPGSPILTVEGTFAEAVLLETIALSVLNHDSAIATAAARMAIAAGDRPLAEMGSRRAGEQSAVAAARAAYIVGVRRHLEPRGRAGAGASPRWGPPRTRGRSCTTPKRTPSARRSPLSASTRRCSIDTYDIRAGRRDGDPCRRHTARRRADRLGRPPDRRRGRCGRSSTSSAPRAPGSP